MRIRLILTVLLIVNVVSAQFLPSRDGWYFENWGESGDFCIGSCDFTWDMFRTTYLGVNPTHDCVEAPLDCAFYEIFKGCAAQGNCGGMSLLALALYKYGGYMGFCSPASFYTGELSPDREDLHRAINIMQARQFSSEGIRNFMDKLNSNDINNANTMFNEVRAALANGDFPIISLANTWDGGDAHTLIPYAVSPDGATPKIVYLWDSNFPFDDHPTRYTDNIDNRLIINDAFDWSYTSGSHVYTGADNGWCFCIPMSKVMRKRWHPLTVEMVTEALCEVFVSAGAAVSQITDDNGKVFYKTEKPVQSRLSDCEMQSGKRIPSFIRWPHFGQARNTAPYELYFQNRSVKDTSGLTFSITGKNYRCCVIFNGSVIELEGTSSATGKDVVRFSRIGMPDQAIRVETQAESRLITAKISQKRYRQGTSKEIVVEKVTARKNMPFRIETVQDLEAVSVIPEKEKLSFSVRLATKKPGTSVQNRTITNCSVNSNERLVVIPESWNTLKQGNIQQVKLPGAIN